MIKEIIHVEKEGYDIIEMAKAGALKTEQESLKTAEEIICQAENNARSDYEKVLADYEEKARMEEEHLSDENQLAKSRILNISPERWNNAVNLVIERIVSGIGDS